MGPEADFLLILITDVPVSNHSWDFAGPMKILFVCHLMSGCYLHLG